MLALVVLAAAGVWFVLAAVFYGMPILAVTGVSMVGAGFAAAYASLKRGSRWGAAGGFALVAAGMGFFLGPAFGTFNTISLAGSHLFMLGAAGMAVALAVGALALRDGLLRIAGFVAAGGALCWVYSDLKGGLVWEPGNLAAAAGAAWIALRPEDLE